MTSKISRQKENTVWKGFFLFEGKNKDKGLAPSLPFLPSSIIKKEMVGTTAKKSASIIQ